VSYDKRLLEPLVLLGLTAAALVASGIGPHDRTTWYLEVAPVVIGGGCSWRPTGGSASHRCCTG
jgi:putative membrane protein